MALELNITAEDIDQLVRDSIMKAGFGKAVEEAVISSLRGYNSPVEGAIKRYVGEIAAELIREKYKIQIISAVQKAIEEKVTDEVIDKTVSAATDRMIRAAEDRY